MKLMVRVEDCQPGPFLWGGELMLKTVDGNTYRLSDGVPLSLPGSYVEPVPADDIAVIPF